jgi:Zn-dependent protease
MIKIPASIPIYIYPFFWLLILALGWLNTQTVLGTAIWGVVIFISVLIHEYGHALTAQFFGQRAEINLVGLGGVTRRQGPTLKPWQDFLVILNGPLAGFALFFITYIFYPHFQHSSVLGYALEVSIYINLFWTVLNLLPILPLDGGHLMRVLLESFFGFNGIKISLLISIVLAALGGLLFFVLQSFLAGSLFLMFAFESYRAWAEIKNVKPHDSSAALQSLLQEAQEDLKIGRENEALSKFLRLREQSQEGVLYLTATQNIARILAHQGHLKQAFDWLSPLEKQLSPEYLHFLQQLAYRLQEWERTIEVGTRAYKLSPNAQTAFLNALSYAIIGQPTPAIGWLQSAAQLGLPNFAQVLQKREFDTIRSSLDFQSLLKKYG